MDDDEDKDKDEDKTADDSSPEEPAGDTETI